MFSFIKKLIGKADTDKPEVAVDAPSVPGVPLVPVVPVVPERHVEGFQPEAIPHGEAALPTPAAREAGHQVETPAFPHGDGVIVESPSGELGGTVERTPERAQPEVSHASTPYVETPDAPLPHAASPVTPAQPASTEPAAAGGSAIPAPDLSAQQPAGPEAKAYWQGRTTSQWKAPGEDTIIVPPPEPEAGAKRSWLTRLKTGLSKTSSGLTAFL